jgi:3-dehydroquinate dehydratase-1
MIDVELSAGESAVESLVTDIRAAGALSVVSSHDFSGTPPKNEIVRTLLAMQALDADIPKLACMPKNIEDVLTLLAASAAFKQLADRPFLCISMGGLGAVSRVAGETFGSALTFGTAEEISAPGQLPAAALAAILDVLHAGNER